VHPRRDIVDAILYVAHNGVVWRALPADFPPWETVYGFVSRWRKTGITARLHDALRERFREVEGRDSQPTAAILDSQSVKGAQTVGSDSRGYDAGKKVNGRTRFVITDTLGLQLAVLVVPATVQDRDCGRRIMVDHCFAHRRCRQVFADGSFAGWFVEWAHNVVKTTVEAVRKRPGQKTFEALPKRWAVERGLAWLSAHWRLVRDYERHPATSESFINWAMIRTMVRRIVRGTPALRRGGRMDTESN